MADLKIKQAEALLWCKEVKEEIVLVENTLSEAREVCNTFPGEGDSIFLMIEKTGELLEETWSHATDCFKKAWDAVEEGIKKLEKAAGDIATDIGDLNAKIKR